MNLQIRCSDKFVLFSDVCRVNNVTNFFTHYFLKGEIDNYI